MALQFLDPGLLRTPIELQSCTSTSDGQGGVDQVWQTIAEIFAHIEPVNALSHAYARHQMQTLSHRITLRYRDDIDLDHRFLRGIRVFEIRNFYDPDETKRYLICKCEEISQ